MNFASKMIRTLLLALGLLFFANLCAPPAAEALLIGTKQEIELGKGVAADLEKKYGVVNDPELQARVARICWKKALAWYSASSRIWRRSP